jgi:hypothetical protein
MPSFLIILLLVVVASAFGEPEAGLVEKQGWNNTAKKVAIDLMKRYAGLAKPAAPLFARI